MSKSSEACRPDLDEFKDLLFRCASEFVHIRDWSLEVCDENNRLQAALHGIASSGAPPTTHSLDAAQEDPFLLENTVFKASRPLKSVDVDRFLHQHSEKTSTKTSNPGGSEDVESPSPRPSRSSVTFHEIPSERETSPKPVLPKAQAEAVLNSILITNSDYLQRGNDRSCTSFAGGTSSEIHADTTQDSVEVESVSHRRLSALHEVSFPIRRISSRQHEHENNSPRSHRTSVRTLENGLGEVKLHQELERWFMQMKPQEGLYLTPEMILHFMNVAYMGNRNVNVRSLQWVQAVMDELNDLVESLLQVPVAAQTHEEQHPHWNMHFRTFVELIQWQKLEHLARPEFRRCILEVRAAIIRNSVDQLICKHSHLEMPNEEDFENSKSWKEQILDIIVGCAIVLNAITIGISADTQWEGFAVCEHMFTSLFLVEILLKLRMHGCCEHFRGKDHLWNIFDVIIVVLALCDAGISALAKSANDIGNITIIRMARLARLTRLMRLLRLLRLRIFKELLLMVKGVVAGLRTLFWAIVLLVFVVYVVGVLLRQTIGEDRVSMHDEYDTVLFENVGWSMFSVFRCFTDDCTLPNGTPLAGHLYQMYGWKFVFPYCIIMLFITFGIFNLIMAIFVENVMESARQKRQLTESAERGRVCRKLRELVLKFGGSLKIKEAKHYHFVDIHKPRLLHKITQAFSQVASKTSESLESQSTLPEMLGSKNVDSWSLYANPTYTVEAPHFQFGGQISREMFQNVIMDPETWELLEDLEIHVSDRSELFDVLDADGSGCLDVSELISGLLKLRSGGADKSDVVAAILGIRSLHKTFTNFMEVALENQRTLAQKADNQEHMLEVVARRPNRFNMNEGSAFAHARSDSTDKTSQPSFISENFSCPTSTHSIPLEDHRNNDFDEFRIAHSASVDSRHVGEVMLQFPAEPRQLQRHEKLSM